ncbi:unannotated protein [freshwater metagenome]|uniref:Unannotated protein n=1 Tax=freshwater metagenome TaxID=449393 RepID=A0A6J7SC71_9ZZZZ
MIVAQPLLRHARRVGVVAFGALAVIIVATVVPGPGVTGSLRLALAADREPVTPALALTVRPRTILAPTSPPARVESPLVTATQPVAVPVATPTAASRARTRTPVASPLRPSTVAGYKSWARDFMATTYRWTTPEQFTCLNNLWIRESQWDPRAKNPTSGALGIPQALPAWKMRAAGSDWRTNPQTQMTWGLGYIKARYGTPCGAWSAFQQKNWY